MKWYKMKIRRVNNQFQITIPTEVIDLLNVKVGYDVVIEYDSNDKTLKLSAEEELTSEFKEALQEGMKAYNEALEDLTER